MKLRCKECELVLKADQRLKAENPFSPHQCDTIFGCPECYEINQFVGLCDEPGCELEISCGTPTPTGYRQTCYKHVPEKK